MDEFIPRYRATLEKYLNYLENSGPFIIGTDEKVMYDYIIKFCEYNNIKEIALSPVSILTHKFLERNQIEKKIIVTALADNDFANKSPAGGHSVLAPEEITRYRFDHLIITSFTYAEEIERHFVDHCGLSTDMISDLRQVEFFIKKRKRTYQRRVDKIKRDSDPKKRIFYFCHVFPFVNYARFKALRQLGYYTVLVVIVPQFGNGPQDDRLSDAFDMVIDLSISDSLRFFSCFHSGILITADTLCHNTLALLAQAVFNGPAVHDVYDLSDNAGYAPDFAQEIIKEKVGNDVEQMEYDARGLLYKYTQGIVYRDSPKALEDLKNNHPHTTPSIHFFPYPEYEDLDGITRTGQCFSIIHCGFISPNLNEDTLAHTILDLVPDIVLQEIEFHILNPADPEFILEREFLARISPEKRKLFRYLEPVFRGELTRTMANYSAGWMVYKFVGVRAVTRRLKMTLSSKLMSYLLAGLPVIISPEFEYMAEFCCNHKIGIVVSSSRVSEIRKKIEGVDWEQLQCNAMNYRQTFAIENHIHIFEKFLMDCCA